MCLKEGSTVEQTTLLKVIYNALNHYNKQKLRINKSKSAKKLIMYKLICFIEKSAHIRFLLKTVLACLKID